MLSLFPVENGKIMSVIIVRLNYWLLLATTPALSLTFLDLEASHLVQNNWIPCEQGSRLVTCILKVINLYPECWAQRSDADSHGFLFYSSAFAVDTEFISGDYIVHGLCHNLNIVSSNDVIISELMTALLPKTCQEVKNLFPEATDGEYGLHIGDDNNPLVLIYCYSMNTENPAEYLTLPTGLGYNVATSGAIGEKNEVTKFEKIRINIETFEVVRDDWTFAQVTGAATVYGEATGCDVPTNEDRGDFMIDLRGTGFSLDPAMHTLATFGHGPIVGQESWSNGNRTLHVRCGGDCGGCRLDGSIILTEESERDKVLYDTTTPKSCADIKRLNPAAKDGEYNLYLPDYDEGVQIYCHRLDTAAPKEYITLPTGPEYNYVIRSNPYGKTDYFKVRMRLRDLTLINNDYTFAASDTNTYLPFGWTVGCWSPEEINMNLTGTRFSFAPHIQLHTWGHDVTNSLYWSSDRKSSNAVCTATCGGCSFTGYYNYQLISLKLN